MASVPGQNDKKTWLAFGILFFEVSPQAGCNACVQPEHLFLGENERKTCALSPLFSPSGAGQTRANSLKEN
jgi:hypothetical protein